MNNYPGGGLVMIGDILQPLAAGFIEAQRHFRLEAPLRAFLKEPLAIAGLPG